MYKFDYKRITLPMVPPPPPPPTKILIVSLNVEMYIMKANTG